MFVELLLSAVVTVRKEKESLCICNVSFMCCPFRRCFYAVLVQLVCLLFVGLFFKVVQVLWR